MTTGPPTGRPQRRTTAPVLGAGVGLALVGTAAGIALSWRDALPDPVASHWSGSDAPDGFSSLGGFVAALVVTSVGVIALFAAIGIAWGSTASTRRLSAAGSVYLGGLLGVVLLGSLWTQRGLDDAAQARESGAVTALALLLPLVPAVLTAVLVPGDPHVPAEGPVPSAAARVDLAEGERVVWLGRAATPPAAVAVLWLAAVGMPAVLAAVFQQWALLVVPALLAVLVLAMTEFTVRVDDSGLLVRSAVGWPRTHVPADEVLEARVEEVSPLGQYGGWGRRVALDGSGRTGVVVRKGPALVVDRTAGRGFVVTVDGAAAAAALLNTLADRTRAR